MTYSVVFLRTFLKQFRRLPRDTRNRIQARVEELAQNPYLGLRLVGQLEGFWKDRVGQYRIIYKIDEKSKTIIFYDADLRKRAYE
ncbi:MAG TPA: type II toxin-antitoxin system RelE/ParE family toxin [Candidatus Bathyarchaeia archaeon]